MGNLHDFNHDDFRISSQQIDNMRLGNSLPESVTTDALRESLKDHFYIEEQVPGRHFAQKSKKRIDMVIRPIDKSRWLNKEVAFGVEIKRDSFHLEKGTGDYCRHFGQSADYASTNWDGYGYLYILTYPTFIPSRIQDQGFFRRLAGRIGVGEIGFTGSGLTALINGHTIWSDRHGVVEGRTWKLERKFGSR